MDCKVNQESLIDFQFGKIDLETRAQVEAHLLGCSACLEELFLLKRDVESAHDMILQPSKETKAKIHREFLAYAYGQLQAHPRTWIVGGLVAAAAMLLVIFSGQFGKLQEKPKNNHAPQLEMIRSLDEAVDSGGENPGHINII
jgi:anti-sigma factor RsiW